MVSILGKLTSSAAANPIVSASQIPLVTPDDKLVFSSREPDGKRLGALSSPGVVNYGGFMYYPHERDRAWADQSARDATIIEMSNNPIIGGVLRQITMYIRQVSWYLEPANESSEALKVKEFYQEQLDGMRNLWPGETMPQFLTFLNWGWSMLEIIYRQLPDGRIGWDEWRLIPQETRWKWILDDRGDAKFLVQIDPQTFEEINVPLWKCIHIRDTARNNSPEGFTLLRVAYDAFFYRTGFQQLEGTLFERFGGVQVARLPGSDIEENAPAYQELKKVVTTLGINSQTGLILSSDRDPATNEYYQDFRIEAPAAGATVPSADTIINRYANEIVGVFGAAITRTGQDGSGSYALADIQAEVFQRNMEAYLDLIADNIQNQAFVRLAEMPFNDIPRELIPKLRHGQLNEVSLKDLGTFLVSLAQAGVIEDSPELRAYTHSRASIPTPPLDQMKKEFEERQQAEEAVQDTKIPPRDSLQGDAQANPPKGELDSQAKNQDKVPVVQKKTG